MISLPLAKLSKKERLARFCRGSGLTRALEALPRRPFLLILNYHRVGAPEECRYNSELFNATVESLDEQVSHLKSRCHVATLEEVVEIVGKQQGKRRRWRHGMALITFDDGYLDNFTQAFPILRSHGVQGTFFLPTSFIGTLRIPWWDAIAFLIKASSCRKIRLRHPYALEIDLCEQGIQATTRQIVRVYQSVRSSPGFDSGEFLAALAESCGVELPEPAPERLFLDWREAAEMLRSGMAIGSHTQSHEILAGLSDEEEEREIRGSREELRRRLGFEAEAFSYPEGLPSSFLPRTCAALERAGYRIAVSYYGGINRPGDVRPFDLRRIEIGADHSLARFRLGTAVTTLAGRH